MAEPVSTDDDGTVWTQSDGPHELPDVPTFVIPAPANPTPDDEPTEGS